MVTASLVKELREKTGAGMMDCKKVLTETDGDIEKAIELLRDMIAGREVVILAPGLSIVKEKEIINAMTCGRFVITINFVTNEYKADALFISNEKRLSVFKDHLPEQIIATSNLKINTDLIFNYSSILGEGDAADNAGAMLIRILKKVNVKKVILAGFDGFDVDSSANYAIKGYQKFMDYELARKKNKDIGKQLKLSLQGIEYEVITKSKYEI